MEAEERRAGRIDRMDRTRAAGRRAHEAEERAVALEARLVRLRCGVPLTDRDVAEAHDAAETSQWHADEATRRAAEALAHSAAAHRSAADLADVAQHAAEAARHRAAADADDRAGARLGGSLVRQGRPVGLPAG